jgi:hypothetical protein
MYSASVEDKATVFCFLETQLTGAPANFIKYPVMDLPVDFQVPQSESAYPINPSFSPLLYTIFALTVDFTYFIMWRALFVCSFEGSTMNCDIAITV